MQDLSNHEYLIYYLKPNNIELVLWTVITVRGIFACLLRTSPEDSQTAREHRTGWETPCPQVYKFSCTGPLVIKYKLRRIKHFKFIWAKSLFKWNSAKPELVRNTLQTGARKRYIKKVQKQRKENIWLAIG